MLGVGVGFDTVGKGSLVIQRPLEVGESDPVIIDDSREGWVESLRLKLDSYLKPGRPAVRFDYSKIRPAGNPLKTFGGKSAGPAVIKSLHISLDALLGPRVGASITSRDIVDIMNIIGANVISGAVRRSAEIAFGAHDDTEFINLKNYKLNPERAAFGWTSNNSIFAELGQDYN
jgi:ribonucleoside-triphosphate reductase